MSNNTEIITKDIHDIIDGIEDYLRNEEQVDCKLTHVFTDGLYLRQIFIPKGTTLTSKIHKTEHPFIISHGIISVWDEFNNEQLLEAPHIGITLQGTRRVLYAHTDVIWTTTHANPDNEKDLKAIEQRLIESRLKKLKQE